MGILLVAAVLALSGADLQRMHDEAPIGGELIVPAGTVDVDQTLVFWKPLVYDLRCELVAKPELGGDYVVKFTYNRREDPTNRIFRSGQLRSLNIDGADQARGVLFDRIDRWSIANVGKRVATPSRA